MAGEIASVPDRKRFLTKDSRGNPLNVAEGRLKFPLTSRSLIRPLIVEISMASKLAGLKGEIENYRKMVAYDAEREHGIVGQLSQILSVCNFGFEDGLNGVLFLIIV